MHTVVVAPEYESWRDAAREMLSRGFSPDDLIWGEDPAETNLFPSTHSVAETPSQAPPRVPSAFVDMAQTAATHTDPKR